MTLEQLIGRFLQQHWNTQYVREILHDYSTNGNIAIALFEHYCEPLGGRRFVLRGFASTPFTRDEFISTTINVLDRLDKTKD